MQGRFHTLLKKHKNNPLQNSLFFRVYFEGSISIKALFILYIFFYIIYNIHLEIIYIHIRSSNFNR